MKCFIRLIIVVSFIFCAFAGKTQGIAIGLQCPDAALTNIINYPVKQAKISDFRGKLLILDFWATWCSPCVTMLSKTDSLQKQFDGKIQIMPVSSQDEKTVSSFLKRLNGSKNILPPSVTGDTVLRKIFAHTYIPHYVWIDGDGTVIAITEMGELTAKNIQAVLDGKKQPLPVKKDEMLSIDRNKAVFALGNPVKTSDQVRIVDVARENVGYYSVFTGYIRGLPTYGTRGEPARISAINVTLAWLYRFAFGRFAPEFNSPNRLILEVQDTSRFFAPPHALRGQAYLNWLSEGNGYCYELQVPPSLADKKFEIMQDELNRYFGGLYGIEGKMEKRMQKVLALVRTSDKDKLATRGLKVNMQENQFYLKLQNVSLSTFLGRLQLKYMQLSPLPLVDETNYTGKVDLEIKASLGDIQAINKELQKYDLQFVEKEKEMDMIVIRDQKKNTLAQESIGGK